MNYTHTTPANKKRSGTAGSRLKRLGVIQGYHTIHVETITNAIWSKKDLNVGEEIEASIDTVGIADGTEIVFSFYEKETGAPDIYRGSVEKTLHGNSAKVTWKYPEDIPPGNTEKYSDSTLYFEAHSKTSFRFSNQIPLYSDLNIKVENENDTAVSNETILIKLSNGISKDSATDRSGKAAFKKVPARVHRIVFPDSPYVVPAQETTGGFDTVPRERTIVAFGSGTHLFNLIDMYAYCSHEYEGRRRAVKNTSYFEVVPKTTGYDAYKDEVTIVSRTATSLSFNGTPLEKRKEQESGMNVFSLKCEQDNNFTPAIWTPEFWEGLAKPNEYPITGLQKTFSIKCYRPDLFRIQLQFPELGKWSGGVYLQTSMTDLKNYIKIKNPMAIEHHSIPKGEGFSLKKFPEKIQSDTTILFSRNGTQIDVKFMDFLGAFVDLSNRLSQIVSLIEDNVPQVGFYFKWECQVLQGTVVLEWGWKEYRDYRAFYYLGVNFDAKLIDVNLEMGVGLSGFTFKIQLYGILTGSVSLSIKTSKVSPEGNAEISIPFGGEIIGSLGARAEVSCWIKMEGTVETGIEVDEGEFKFSREDGLSVGCGLTWSGIVGRVKVSAGVAKKEGTEELKSDAQVIAEQSHNILPNETDEKGHSEYERTLIQSMDLKRWEWSRHGAKEYNPAIIPGEDLHKLLKKRFGEGNGVKIKIGERWHGIRTQYMPVEDIATIIEGRINSRNDIRKDPKSADALALRIRASLDAIAESRFRGTVSYMEQQEFDSFLDSEELKSIFDDDIDPISLFIRDKL